MRASVWKGINYSGSRDIVTSYDAAGSSRTERSRVPPYLAGDTWIFRVGQEVGRRIFSSCFHRPEALSEASRPLWKICKQHARQLKKRRMLGKRINATSIPAPASRAAWCALRRQVWFPENEAGHSSPSPAGRCPVLPGLRAVRRRHRGWAPPVPRR